MPERKIRLVTGSRPVKAFEHHGILCEIHKVQRAQKWLNGYCLLPRSVWVPIPFSHYLQVYGGITYGNSIAAGVVYGFDTWRFDSDQLRAPDLAFVTLEGIKLAEQLFLVGKYALELRVALPGAPRDYWMSRIVREGLAAAKEFYDQQQTKAAETTM